MSATSRIERYLSISSSNVLENFNMLKELIAGCRIVIFLDYDGTLTPIVNDPENALLSTSMKAILDELHHYFITGVISGRSLPKVQSFVGISGLFYAGSHGFDIVGPNGTAIQYQVASEYIPLMASIRQYLEQALSPMQGIYIEDNLFSISVHYRNINPQQVPEVKDIIAKSIENFPGIRIFNGKKVFELKPNIPWNKGSAIKWILQVLGLYGNENVFTLYIGDDTTDEDAFRVFSVDTLCKGVGIIVAEEGVQTHASFTLRNPNEVMSFLQNLTQFGRETDAKSIATDRHA